MKTITLLFLAVTTISAWTQGVEPSGDMTVKPSAVFSCDVTLIENRIVETLGQLQGVEHNTQSGGQRFQRREWKPDFPKDSWMAKNCALMSLAIFEVQWMPPKPPSQKTSNGGANIKPVSSKITIEIGCLKTNRQAVVVRLSREWTYNARTHIPYTEIPLWRGKSSEQGSYSSDGIWLHQLMPEKLLGSFSAEVVYSVNVVSALNAAPTGAAGDDSHKNLPK